MSTYCLEKNVLLFSLSTGYSPHPTYGMVVQDYANTYPGLCQKFFVESLPSYSYSSPSIVSSRKKTHTGYGPNSAYGGCSGPYGTSLGPGVYPVSSVPSPYSPTTNSCYAMPPPQHLPSHDKLLSKDGWVSSRKFCWRN